MSQVFDLASRIVDGTAAGHPIFATYMGVPGFDHLLTDQSPAAYDARAEQARGWLAELDTLPVENDDDRLAVAVMRERLESRLAVHDLRLHLRDVNVLGCPVQHNRNVFTMMPTADDADWAVIAARLEQVPGALAGLREAYEAGIAEGVLPARRQVLGAAQMAAVCAGREASAGTEPTPWFGTYVAGYAGDDDALRARLEASAAAATAAYADLADWMRGTYADAAVDEDGVGADVYRTMARVYSGTDIDPQETYAWGWADLAEITRRMNDCAARLYGGVTPFEAMERLDADPEWTIEGAEDARAWLQQVTDGTTASFNGTYFDIPDQMLRCEAMLAPAGAAAAPYYTAPSEDFSRPGRTWLPVVDTSFRKWWLLSVWYHEAVPGHHLQLGYVKTQTDRLSRFQRMEFISGNGEGWALYAERLMDELGYFSEAATELGYLSNQALRAARVVIDIGLHLGLAIPADIDPVLVEGLAADPRGRVWDADIARDFLRVRGLQTPAFAASEIDRYLGLPGQAICYKVGEREWLAARADAQAAAGESFDLKAWHMRALALGSVGLSVLREELARV
ncbi:DUF885 domain-containing protein [Longivirga aurantiaca]|uniref:DUF885 domain-containing protein n=1 Tax=Longivirga aurantiaca TaxID=1837743 RepID=A0ABW1T409_9ACTN